MLLVCPAVGARACIQTGCAYQFRIAAARALRACCREGCADSQAAYGGRPAVGAGEGWVSGSNCGGWHCIVSSSIVFDGEDGHAWPRVCVPEVKLDAWPLAGAANRVEWNCCVALQPLFSFYACLSSSAQAQLFKCMGSRAGMSAMLLFKCVKVCLHVAHAIVAQCIRGHLPS